VLIDLTALPDDAGALRAIVLAQAAALADQRALIERLRLQLARLRRMQFGRSSERLATEADQLELALEELETEAPIPSPAEDTQPQPSRSAASLSAARCRSTCHAR
jgi:hypothetical protein